jgi:hypothetical protein
MFTKQFARSLAEMDPGKYAMVKFPRTFKGDRKVWMAWKISDLRLLPADAKEEVAV